MKLIKKIFTSKVSLLGSFTIWLFSIIAFLISAILFQNPSGVYTDSQAIVIVLEMLVGVVAFGAFCLLLFGWVYRKIRAWAVVILILLAMVPISLGVFVIGRASQLQQLSAPVAGTTQVPTFTGQEIFDEVNRYRVENEVEELKLDPNLCNNLAQRYLDIKQGLEENIAHKNFQEWYEEYVEPYGGYVVAENFAWGNTPSEVVKAWEGSPGHRLSVLNPDSTLGCSYASEGYGVLILGYRQKVAQNYVLRTEPERTGNIIDYHEWCTDKDISIYENELLTKQSSDGNVYTMTEGDWSCYEDYLARQ